MAGPDVEQLASRRTRDRTPTHSQPLRLRTNSITSLFVLAYRIPISSPADADRPTLEASVDSMRAFSSEEREIAV